MAHQRGRVVRDPGRRNEAGSGRLQVLLEVGSPLALLFRLTYSSVVTNQTRRLAPAGRSFARHARAALEKYLPEARTDATSWRAGANEAWVRFPRADGLYGYVGLRRHLDWVTGEAGVSREPRELGERFALPGTSEDEVPGYRIRLGELLHAEDRWWPAGQTEPELIERLEWLALQLAVKSGSYFRRWPGGKR